MFFIYSFLIKFLYPITAIFCALVVVIVFWNHKFARYFLILVTLFFYFTGTGLIPYLLIDPLQSEYSSFDDRSIAKSDALIVLGGGLSGDPDSRKPQIASYSRIFEAFRVYQKGLKEGIPYTIYVSGGGGGKEGITEAEVFRSMFIDLGVPESKIYMESKSKNTFENAKFTSVLLKNNQVEHPILITSGYHMKRAMLYFHYFGIQPIPDSSDSITPRGSWIPNAYSLAYIQMAIHEWVGIASLRVYHWLGAND